MQSTAQSVDQYISGLSSDRQEVVQKLRATIAKKVPAGFVETMQYGMISRVVPHTIYPDGYHCKPSEPLPFIALASQKNFVALYHMGIYADETLLQWFQIEFSKHSKKKLDMGKSCIRFKDMQEIPNILIGELASKMTVKHRISIYKKQYKNKK